MKFLSSALLVFSTLLSTAFGDEFVFGQIEGVKLPKPLSDHTADRHPTSGLVYITGGCDGDSGNEWFSDIGDNGMFLCGSISDNLFSFNPEDGTFQVLKNMPRPRYRHSAAIANNQIWIVGGRDLDDNLIPEIDVYDIATTEWSIYQLPEKYQVSDHSSFSSSGKVFLVGGYPGDYSFASSTVVTLELSEGQVVFNEVGSLNVGRGDVHSVVSDDGKSAFVAGGFNPDTTGFWCTPLRSVERYDFSMGQWSTIPNLTTPRSEVVLVELENHLIALGGESPLNVDACMEAEYVDPGEMTQATDVVEILNDDATAWIEKEEFPEERFRFAAVGVVEQGLIYAFGGQKKYGDECNCQDGSDAVFIHGRKEDVLAVGGTVIGSDGSSGTSLSLVTALFVSVLTFGYAHLY